MNRINWKIGSHKENAGAWSVCKCISIKPLDARWEAVGIAFSPTSLRTSTSIINILLLLNMSVPPKHFAQHDHVQSIFLRFGEITWSDEGRETLSTAWKENLKIPNWQRFKKEEAKRKLFVKRTHNYRNNEKKMYSREIEENHPLIGRAPILAWNASIHFNFIERWEEKKLNTIKLFINIVR